MSGSNHYTAKLRVEGNLSGELADRVLGYYYNNRYTKGFKLTPKIINTMLAFNRNSGSLTYYLDHAENRNGFKGQIKYKNKTLDVDYKYPRKYDKSVDYIWRAKDDKIPRSKYSKDMLYLWDSSDVMIEGELSEFGSFLHYLIFNVEINDEFVKNSCHKDRLVNSQCVIINEDDEPDDNDVPNNDLPYMPCLGEMAGCADLALSDTCKKYAVRLDEANTASMILGKYTNSCCGEGCDASEPKNGSGGSDSTYKELFMDKDDDYPGLVMEESSEKSSSNSSYSSSNNNNEVTVNAQASGTASAKDSGSDDSTMIMVISISAAFLIFVIVLSIIFTVIYYKMNKKLSAVDGPKK